MLALLCYYNIIIPGAQNGFKITIIPFIAIVSATVYCPTKVVIETGQMTALY